MNDLRPTYDRVNSAEISPTNRRRFLPPALAALAAGLLLLSLRLPLWQMRLEAPQYRDQEALRIAVHPNALRGDLRELTVLDQYIGVHVPPTLPQFKWLPALLLAGAALGLVAGFLGNAHRSRALLLLSLALALALGVAALQAIQQMHQIGHHRDTKTVLAGVKDFTPPFLGTNKIAQFTVSSRLGFGAWFIGGALTLQLVSAWLSRRSRGHPAQSEIKRTENQAQLVPATSHGL